MKILCTNGLKSVMLDLEPRLQGKSATRPTLVWGSTAGFLNSGNALMFGSTTSSSEAALTNGIDLNGATRTIQVTGASNTDFATQRPTG